MSHQTQWRFCQNCFSLFYNGFPEHGACANGGAHVAAGFDFALPFNLPETPNSQFNWRFCGKCMSLFWDGDPARKGACPRDHGPHVAVGFNFAIPYGLLESPHGQSSWRFCGKCSSMYYAGFPSQGRCPEDGQSHLAAGLIFRLPHDLPPQVQFSFDSIVLPGGIPVGGFAHLVVRQDGSFAWSGHAHDSGGVGFNVGMIAGLKEPVGRVFTFFASGHVSGTFESGSRDFDFVVNQQDNRLAESWANIASGSTVAVRTSVTLNLEGLTQTIVEALGQAAEIIGIVV
jgi:hypothetical protein